MARVPTSVAFAPRIPFFRIPSSSVCLMPGGRGRGRGGGDAAPGPLDAEPAVAKAPVPCTRAFETMPEYLYPAYATVAHICKTCGHAVHAHPPSPAPASPHVGPAALGAALTGAAVPSAPEVVLGPLLVPPADAGQIFLRVIDSWILGPWCRDDTDTVRAALHYLQTSLFDGSTTFIRRTFRVTGPLDASRNFTLLPELEDHLEARRTRGRDLMAMVNLATRAVIPLGLAHARQRHFAQKIPLPVARAPSGISTEIAASAAYSPSSSCPATNTGHRPVVSCGGGSG